MQGLIQQDSLSFTEIDVIPENPGKRRPRSHDPGYDFSLEHWAEVYHLVQEEVLLAEIAAGEGTEWYSIGRAA